MADQNSVFQIICQNGGGAAYTNMCAGSGWFPNMKQMNCPEGTILTNAHVVRNAKDIFIRLPAAHNTDIRAYVRGISSDLDIAVLELKPQQLKQVKAILSERYGTSEIPQLTLADSNSVHPKHYTSPVRPPIFARGYPLGTEYQMTTQGIVSGLKHTRNQVYIVTTATINSGNSGGPCVNEAGEVIGINSMKLVSKGVEEINMIIPSNRIKRTLPLMLDNHENIDVVHKALARILFQKQLMKLGLDAAKVEQAKSVAELMHEVDEDVDYKVVVSNWNQHNIGGFKRGKDGVVTPVTISDWFTKHVHNNPGGHSLFKQVFEKLHNNEIDEVVSMRKKGFKNFYCNPCMTEELGCGKDHGNKGNKNVADQLMSNVVVPPRILHIPKLGFTYSHGTGKPMLEYYKAPPQVKSGIIISSISRCGLFNECGFLLGDVLYSIDEQPVSDYGEVWLGSRGVSLNVLDVLSSVDWGSVCVCGVLRGGSCVELEFRYRELRGVSAGELRLLDSVLDVGVLRGEVLGVKGVELKPLRLNDVLEYKMLNYMGDEHAHKFRIMVSNIDTHSTAYHAKSIRPGDILSTFNEKPIPNNWKDFAQMVSEHPEDQPLHLTTESNRIIVL